MTGIRRIKLTICWCAIAVCVMFLFCSFAFAQEAPVFAWERDVHNHWQLDQQGERINLGEHVLDEALVCSVCGSQVVAWDDGSGDVGNYDEHGNFVHGTSFDADGAVTYDGRHILSYDENGVLVLDVEYINGVLFGETTFTADTEGNAIPVKQIAYYDDGTTSVNEYDEHGNCVSSKSYEADGTLSVEILSEYLLDADGWYYEAKSTTRFSEGRYSTGSTTSIATRFWRSIPTPMVRYGITIPMSMNTQTAARYG